MNLAIATSFSVSPLGQRPTHCPYNPYPFHLDHGKAREFVGLHDQVKASTGLLDSLESFLATFQKDLSLVSGQISELQDRSKDIDNRLRSRRKIEKPLSGLLSELVIPPPLANTLLSTDVGEPWIPAIQNFETRLESLKARSRVKAARDLADVAEGLRIVVATKLRAFFLAIFQPIRESATTNMQVMQASVLMKYRPLFAFLQRQAPPVAQEVQRSYAGAVRTYYETGFRRYIRSLGWIKSRSPQTVETIIPASGEKGDADFGPSRLMHAKLDGPGVILAFMGDNKSYKESTEAIYRSLMMVLMDNATAEYSFVMQFFRPEPFARPTLKLTAFSPGESSMLLSPDRGGADDRKSVLESELATPIARTFSHARGESDAAQSAPLSKTEQASLDALWKQIVEPILDYSKTFISSLLEPSPSLIPILTMARLSEVIIAEVQRRGCAPLETFMFTIRLQIWPIFQKVMSEQVEALRKLAEGSSTSYFSRAATTTDESISAICTRYAAIFVAFVTLTEQEEETMTFSNLLRLRQELTKLIIKHTDSISDPGAKATKQSSLYEVLLQALMRNPQLSVHPKSQQESAYWAEKEEEARRRIVSVNQGKRSGRR
ncbi:Vps52-domain-containing protein [Coniophora puteana RWD-64-598 SS2]|uniref:Vps52-domain-containing protein n=1 Tax=Coniophora puteana (strain RWD-64-598) TaxID=741705 RepID=A0A5M3MU80_CONPW|nr:Vps52-domain-containing protein [Coniophora puteana RWD-64-598 SS2]EIW82324.1 Vps52-domain-containing protein [Coniophora puteana RWD-64-598 SS2]